MSSWKCRAIVLVLLVIYLSGCVTWRRAEISPVEAIQTQPDRVRLTLVDSTTVVVPHPVLMSDSIATIEQVCEAGSPGEPLHCTSQVTALVALADVAALELREAPTGAKGVVLVVSAIALVALLLEAAIDPIGG